MGKEWPWLIAGALLAGVALSVAAFAVGSGTTTVTMLAVALTALAVGQGVAVVRGYLGSGLVQQVAQNQQDMAATVINLSNENRRINAESINLAHNVSQFRQETQALNSSLSEGLATLRKGHESVAGNLQTILDSQRDIQNTLSSNAARLQTQAELNQAMQREQQWLSQVTGHAEEPVASVAEPEPEAAPDFENSEIGNSLNLALEPIVDLYTSNTAHYRMVLGMTNQRGDEVPQDLFLLHAERLGLRDALDQHVVEQAVALLVQLRQRDSALCIFVPVGAATLAQPDAVHGILQTLSDAGDLAQGIVLDLAHAVLASLPEASLEGLATLARNGVQLSLSQASISGVDLASLNRLNVRYVSVAASSVGVGFQISAGLPGFVQSARALRIQIVISQVSDPRHVTGLARTARYASGPAFAAPRKLKRTQPDAQAYTAAA